MTVTSSTALAQSSAQYHGQLSDEDRIQQKNATTADDAEASLAAGLIAMELCLWDEAVSYFSQALSANPRLAAAYENRGRALDRIGKGSEALKDFDRLLQLEANNPSG